MNVERAGDNQLIHYQATADPTGFYACINGGNKHPQAASKEAFEGPVSGEGTVELRPWRVSTGVEARNRY